MHRVTRIERRTQRAAQKWGRDLVMVVPQSDGGTPWQPVLGDPLLYSVRAMEIPLTIREAQAMAQRYADDTLTMEHLRLFRLSTEIDPIFDEYDPVPPDDIPRVGYKLRIGSDDWEIFSVQPFEPKGHLVQWNVFVRR